MSICDCDNPINDDKIMPAYYDVDLSCDEAKIIADMLSKFWSKYSVSTRKTLSDMWPPSAESDSQINFEVGRFKTKLRFRVFDNGQDDDGDNQTVNQYIVETKEFLYNDDIKFIIEADEKTINGCFASTVSCQRPDQLIETVAIIEYLNKII